MTKVCTKCGESKSVDDFNKDKSTKDNLQSKCKLCQKKYRLANKDKLMEIQRNWRKNNPDKVKKYYDNSKDYQKEYYEINKEKKSIQNKNYYEQNKNELQVKQKVYNEVNKNKRNERERNRRANDPLYALTVSTRNLINESFKNSGVKKNSKTAKLLGCTFEEFKEHIESQWEDWMTWDNRGLYNGEEGFGWDIDHIIPISSAETEEDIIKLNHYTNLQPLCSYINRIVKKDLRV